MLGCTVAGDGTSMFLGQICTYAQLLAVGVLIAAVHTDCRQLRCTMYCKAAVDALHQAKFSWAACLGAVVHPEQLSVVVEVAQPHK